MKEAVSVSEGGNMILISEDGGMILVSEEGSMILVSERGTMTWQKWNRISWKCDRQQDFCANVMQVCSKLERHNDFAEVKK